VLLELLRSIAPTSFNSLRVRKPTVGSRSAADDIVWLEGDGHRVALKRCAKNVFFVKREIFVHRLRVLCGMQDYVVCRVVGIKLRAPNSQANCPPFLGWEGSELVMIDFGTIDMRKNFGQLATSEIRDIQGFFEQYGRWCAFNYISGAQDRHAANFVYDMETGTVYSVDNEERPVDASNKFVPFDSGIDNYRQNVQRFLPPETEGRGILKMAFEGGFIECWNIIRERLTPSAIASDSVLSSDDAKPDLSYCQTVLYQADPLQVIARINL
jgi:hypothetical protein